jgi:hypothetical protein
MRPYKKERTVFSTFASTAIAASGDLAVFTGAPTVAIGDVIKSIPRAEIKKARWIGGFAGQGQKKTGTVTVATGKTYEFALLQQDVAGKTNTTSVITVVSTTTDAATFYGLAEVAVQNLIDTGVFEGTVDSDSNGLVLTGSVERPFLSLTSLTTGTELWTFVDTAVVLGSPSISNAAPRVLTVTAHNLTVGDVYAIKISGATGTGAADVNRNLYGVVASATTITLIGTTNSGAVAGTIVAELIPIPKNDFSEYGQNTVTVKPVAGYVKGVGYLGLAVENVFDGDLARASVEQTAGFNQFLFNASDADMSAVFIAATTVFAGNLTGVTPGTDI